MNTILDYLKVFNNINKRKPYEPRTMAQGGRIIGKPGGLVEPGVMYYANKVKVDVAAETTSKFRNDISNWTENWINKNADKYKLRDFEKFKKNLSEAWLKESKNKKYKVPGVGTTKARILTKNGLPNIATTKSVQPFNMLGFEMPGGVSTEMTGSAQRNFFSKIFYKKHLNKNTDLAKSFNSYLDYMVADKRGTNQSAHSKIVRNLMKKSGVDDPLKLINDDVVYLLSNDSGLGGKARYELFTDTFGKKYTAYQDKMTTAQGSWNKAQKIIKAKTGIDIRKQLRVENEALRKLFKVTELPDELKYAGDHIFGVSQAAQINNKKFMKAAIDNLVGMTATQNRFLGMGTFEKQRGKLVNKINKAIGSDKAKFVEELNTLMGNTYSSSFPKETKFYALDKGKLNINPDLKKLSQEERFMGWATDISKKPTKILKETFTDKGVLKNMLALKKGDPTKMNKFLNLTGKSMQDLSPRSIAQLTKEFPECGTKGKGGSIMTCLQGKFKANPEKFLQKAVPLAKDNANLFKWFKNGRKIARGTGIALAWEAAFAPIIGGWAALEGESGARIINEIAYGIPGIGETTKEEWMREAGGDEKAELAYKMQRMGELEEQELPYLQQQRNDVINKMSNVEGKSFHQRTIEDDIKEKNLELQALYNTPEFSEGPVGSYYNEPVIQGAFDLEQQTTAKIAADKAERKKAAFDWLEQNKIYANQNWQSQVSRADGGIMNLKKKW